MLRRMLLTSLAVVMVAVPAVTAGPGEGTVQEPRPGDQKVGDGLIVPGQRVGPARLTMTMEQIIAAIGSRPKRDEFAADGVVLYEWRSEGLWVSQTIATKAIRVISAFGTSEKYRTDKGVALIHPRSKMEEIYGKGYKEYSYPEDRITLIRYHDLGLQFGIINQPSNFTIHNKIFQIGVFKPGDLPPLRRTSR